MASYFSRWVAGVIIGITVVGTANWYLDAYGYWGNADGVFYSSERKFKASQIGHFEHDGILLGTSRMAHIDPDRVSCVKFFNAGFSSASLEEVIEFTERFVKKEKVIVLGLDFQMFEDVKKAKNAQGGFGRTPRDFIEHLLSLELLYKGVLAARHIRAGLRPKVLANGQRNTSEKDAKNAALGTVQYDIKAVSEFRNRVVQFRMLPESEILLRRLKHLLKQRTKHSVVIFNPINRILADDEGHMDNLLGRIASTIREVFPDARDLSRSQYANADRHYKFDYSHFTPDTGVSFVNEALSQTYFPCTSPSAKN
ncbi:MAG: hypothetical protein GKS01_09795 [Alphaproteobacteria bacterium]|nr:hypothetical protein [Alphaproteobacteria bacterium]